MDQIGARISLIEHQLLKIEQIGAQITLIELQLLKTDQIGTNIANRTSTNLN